MQWFFYHLTEIPDLSLAKYQSLEETGVEGVLEKHNAFLRQWQRLSSICKIGIHLFISYYPDKSIGEKLEVNLGFSYEEESLTDKIRQLMNKSPLSDFFQFHEDYNNNLKNISFPSMVTMKKNERKRITEDESHTHLFTIDGWESRENARLYDMIRNMEALNEEVVYTVSLYGIDAYEKVDHILQKPIAYLRKKLFGQSDSIHLRENRPERVKDTASENTLKSYEELLNTTSTSPCFSANVKVFAQNPLTAQILLNAACAEAIEKGNCQIEVLPPAQYPVLSAKNECTFYTNEVPKSLEFLPTLFSLEEIQPFFRFPTLFDGEYIEIQKETTPSIQNEGLCIGKSQQDKPVNISTKALSKHAFVCGVPGSGKTNTMLHIANSLWHNKDWKFGELIEHPIPFLVLEPAKREYRELSLFDIPELIIFSPNANTKFPFCINPFEFPKGLTLSEHITRLCQVFEGAFPIQPPAPFILDRSIEAIYKMHGWNSHDINDGSKEYPTLSELYTEFEKQLLSTSYDSEIQGNIRSVLEMRIGSLLRREKKNIFDVKRSIITPEEWLKKPIILELEALGKETSNFVTLLVCSLIRETLKVNPMNGIETQIDQFGKKETWKPLRHVIFIEEAHNLIAPQNQMDNAQDSNPKIAATECIVDMLKEVRALREGMIIADQLPTAMAMDVIKNTNIKIMHRLTSGDDRGMMGSTMSASDLQMEQVATYTPGQTLMSYEGLLKPFELQVQNLENHGETPNDESLYQNMKNKPGQEEIYRRFEGRKWMELQNSLVTVLQLEQANRKALGDYEFETKSATQKEEFFNQCYLKYQTLLLMRQSYQNEYENLPKDFMETDHLQKTQAAIKNIGKLYFQEIRKYIETYM